MQPATPVFLTVLTLTFSLLACTDNSNSGTTATPSDTAAPVSITQTASPSSIVKTGDTVWVLVNHVKANKRQQFEQFVHDVFWDSSSRLTLDEQQVFRQTRVLHPTKPEKNGTFSYIFLMDPYVPGGNYDMEQLLTKIYGAPKAAQYSKMYNEAVVGDQTAYIEVQSRH
jgi:hypothetical protein